MYERIHHVALVVRELEKVRSFYEAVLGFPISPNRPAFDFDGIWYDIGNTELHLIVPKEGIAEDAKTGHFAIRVTNMSGMLERLDRFGISYRSDPDSITGWHQVFVTDPEGNLIELNALTE